MIAPDGVLLGIVAAVDVERAIERLPDGPVTAGGLAHSVPQLRAEHSLEDAVRALGTSDREGIPVVDQAGRVIGWITHRQVFRAYLGANGTPVSQPALPRLTPTGPRDSNRLGN